MFECIICNKILKTKDLLTRHLKKIHLLSKEKYTIDYILNGNIPKCICGCEEDIRIVGYNINKYKHGHSGGGNWQTKYDKDSVEYNSIIKRISDNTSKSMIGIKKSKKHRKNISKGRKNWIQENREYFDYIMTKMRKTKIKQIEDGVGCKIYPSFNPDACLIIEQYGKDNGYKFQHAMNGGEYFIKELGYWVDGYDRDKNVVIEYYEKYHSSKEKRDNRRRKEIMNYLKCDFIILHENKNTEIFNYKKEKFNAEIFR